MSIKLFGTMFLIAIAVLAPINSHFNWLPTIGVPHKPNEPSEINPNSVTYGLNGIYAVKISQNGYGKMTAPPDPTYLWAYLVFTYIFTGLAIYYMTSQTNSIIKVRQKFLGSQPSTKNRTFRLSRIPSDLRSEDRIKNWLEGFDIGRVENVNIIRNCKNLDIMMRQRAKYLRKLEIAWALYYNKQKNHETVSTAIRPSTYHDYGGTTSGERDPLIGQGEVICEPEASRPKKRVFLGLFRLHHKKVDMIDFYGEKLRKLDDKIIEARKIEHPATSMAFVTMETTSACQIVVQTLLNSSPTHLLAKPAPASTDIVWHNTYLPRYSRMIRAWVISIFIIILTMFWVVPVAALAGLLDLCSIQRVFPNFAEALSSHKILKSLVQTGLPTLIVSLLNIGVPYLHDFLSNKQGMISQGDVELSMISKNFFFTFFNVFLTFTVAGTVTKFQSTLEDSLKSTTSLALKLAGSVQQVAVFYINFILFQGIGLIPLRLLELGSVCLYPIMYYFSKTPRDYWKLTQPPVFKYGFFLPSAILIYMLCIVYSILPAGYMVLFFGVIYFITSYYTYKYQLLYAMDSPQHTDGGAWLMICYRLLLGLEVFQIVMAGIIALKNQVYVAGLVVPLIPFSIWYSYYFGRTYQPLLRFIALQKVKNDNENTTGDNNRVNSSSTSLRGRNDDAIEERRENSSFVNPCLNVP